MNNMFSKCKKLQRFPEKLNWNTSHVTDMCSLFAGCILLESLPDISKWDT